jgi:asparagine synthase (glutamine-hydrolysing)
VHIFFSDISDLDQLDLPPFSINERYIAASIYTTDIQIRETAFNEVREVLAGDRVDISDRGLAHSAGWDPRRIAVTEGAQGDLQTAARSLRETTQMCVDAWANYDRSVLVSLSGGLDSAIVLGCLGRSRNRAEITCFNQYRAADALGDERHYARAAAKRAGARLVEKPWTGSRYTARLFEFPRSAKPTATDLHFMLEMDFRNELATEARADAVWTGQGGDHLFWTMRALPVAADYLYDRGVDRRLFALIGESARLAEKSYWSTSIMAARFASSRNMCVPESMRAPTRHFVSADALGKDVAEYIAHPWSARSEGLAPVKHAQIFWLIDVLNRHRHLARAERAYERHPLLSQPLIELCLTIPTYLLVAGGQSRALARIAFEQLLPEEILRRTSKGDYSAQARQLVRESEAFLRDLLLNGVLVRRGLVSRAELERHLVHGQSLKGEQFWALTSCVAVEVWAETWRRNGQLRWAA